MRWRRHSVPDPAGELRALPGPLAAGPRREGRERRRNGRMRVKGTGEKGSDVNKTFLSRPRPRPRLWVSRPRPRPPYFFKTNTKTKTLPGPLNRLPYQKYANGLLNRIK